MSSSFLFANCPDDIARLREALDHASYTVEDVRRVMGEGGFAFLTRGELAPVLRRTQGGSPIETLIRLFLCGAEVDHDAATRALTPLTLDTCAAAGLIAVAPSGVTGLIKLRPYEVTGRRWLVAYDSTEARDAHAPDFVIGVGAASMTLASMTVRPPIERCLDLGTGGGVQALHASEHAASVVATDRNPRAVAFATFTIALNGITNVSTRQGDLFAPVAGERFDLIVSNPPYVISPESRLDYRDSPLPVDGICQRIVEQAPAHLEDNGWCQLLANWAHLGHGDWKERLAAWFAGSGCDAWVIQREVQDVERYASTWIRHDEPDPTKTGDTFNAWMDFYEQADVAAVGSGLITMRRTSRPTPQVRIDELTQEIAVPCGEAIRAAFERSVWLAERADDQRLLAARLRVAGDVRLREQRVVTDGRWTLHDGELALDEGLRYLGSIDPQGAGLIAGCDGRRPLRDLLQRMADSIGMDLDAIAPQALAIVRRLIEQGFLLPEGEVPTSR
jgi:methylase of polypeptide subunit release factors